MLRGEHVVLEPLDLAHADELFAATADPEVWRHLGSPQPADRRRHGRAGPGGAAAHHRGERVPWVQRCAVTGAVVGTTSFYEIDPARRSVAIGYTWLGRPWWRTGINTEAKLLLLAHAFDELGAVRVVWHTDIRNERSQRAIERLGATREGVLRRHRQRPDGSWRDTVAVLDDRRRVAERTGQPAGTASPGGLRRDDGGVLGITDIWTYVLGTVAIVLLPGPNSLFVLSTAARRGRTGRLPGRRPGCSSATRC